MRKERVRSLSAMAFYHADGLVAAYKQAQRFAGKGGRLATMPDIVEARLVTSPGEVPWERYFTTLSAEYVGFSKAGNPIVIVAHGIGPMNTLDGILAAYSHQFKDKSRDSRGGRIPQELFLRLESGAFGDVAVIDLSSTWDRREYQFSGHAITSKEISEEPLWQARLGGRWEAYVEHHAKFANDFHRECNEGPYVRPCIIGMDDAANCSYSTRKMFDHWMSKTPRTALAHLLSIGSLANSHHQYHEHDYKESEHRTSLACDVSCHEWSDGVRFLAIQPGGSLDNVHPGLDISRVIRLHWKELLLPVESPDFPGAFYALTKIDESAMFTQYPKKGEGMDTHEPEFRVTSIERVPGPETFSTTIGGYHGFFKYGIREVQAIAPNGANAYYLPGEVQMASKTGGDPTHHVTAIEFYHVEVDTSKRLIRASDLQNNYDLMMKLAELEGSE